MKKGLVLFLLFLAAIAFGMPAKEVVKESLCLHTDRDVYISGESLYFKVYLFDPTGGRLSDKSKIVYILIYDSNNIPVFRECLNLSGGMGNSSFYLPDTLKTGNYLFVAFTNWMRNFGDSTFFRKEIFIANRFDTESGGSTPGINATDNCLPDTGNNLLKVFSREDTYHTREKVRLQLSIPSGIQANISVSVSEKSLGPISTVPGINVSLPNYCKVHSFNGTRDTINYPMELKGYIIGGSIRNPKSVSGIPVILSAPDSIPNIVSAFTDSRGRFYFQLDKYYLNRELIVQIADSEIARESTLTLDNKYECSLSFISPENNNPDSFTKFLQKSQTIVKIDKIYSPHTNNDLVSPELSPLKKRVYYKSDMKVFTADFIPLNNFHEIVRETLPGARIRKNGNNYSMEILDMDRKEFMEDPALFINGIFVNNLNSIIQYGSDKVISTELIFHKRAYGPLLFNGIVSILTTDVKNDVFPAGPYLKIQPIRFLSYGKYQPMEYLTPEKLNSRSPDFRQLLIWDPSVLIENDKTTIIEFYTSDNTGRYSIHIEGIASDGQRIHYVSSFDVLNTPDNL